MFKRSSDSHQATGGASASFPTIRRTFTFIRFLFVKKKEDMHVISNASVNDVLNIENVVIF